MRRLVCILFLVSLTMLACGGSAVEDTQSADGVPPSEEITIGIQVDVSETIVGDWKVEGFSIGETSPDIDTTSHITFGEDNTLSSFSVKPLYHFEEDVFEPIILGTCADVAYPEGIEGETRYGGLFNAQMSYTVTETSANTILKFILEGDGANFCCSAEIGGCHDDTMPETELHHGVKTVGYLVLGATENGIALISNGSTYYVLLTRETL